MIRRPPTSTLFPTRRSSDLNIHNPADLAPRVSFAWGLGKGAAPKTVLRFGAGIFYDRFSMSQVLQAELLNGTRDRKSTRLNSSHSSISYAVFCLKKKITYNS